MCKTITCLLCQEFPVVFLHNMVKWRCDTTTGDWHMFYAYVQKLPMVEGNLELSRGDRLDYSYGSIRKSKTDLRGDRAFVLMDKSRNVYYRVTKAGLLVEYPESAYFVKNPEVLKTTPFAVEGDAAEINSFLLLCSRISDEHRYRRSWVARIRYFTKEPIGITLMAGAIIYAVATFFVLVFG